MTFGEKKVVIAGGAYHIPGDVVHSGKTQGAPSEVIEVFAPVRDDLMRD